MVPMDGKKKKKLTFIPEFSICDTPSLVYFGLTPDKIPGDII